MTIFLKKGHSLKALHIYKYIRAKIEEKVFSCYQTLKEMKRAVLPIPIHHGNVSK
ncbi:MULTISPECIES: hypothetical protein [unclassified Lysinibacillus]|uniref:hypothetical protein n=1 Tax=unclassified Lysinibacillus TaxID=2636778 RepID=UPI0038238F71